MFCGNVCQGAVLFFDFGFFILKRMLAGLRLFVSFRLRLNGKQLRRRRRPQPLQIIRADNLRAVAGFIGNARHVGTLGHARGNVSVPERIVFPLQRLDAVGFVLRVRRRNA